MSTPSDQVFNLLISEQDEAFKLKQITELFSKSSNTKKIEYLAFTTKDIISYNIYAFPPGLSPLHIVILKNYEKILSYFLNPKVIPSTGMQAIINRRFTVNQQSLLHHVIISNRHNLISMLVKAGADINIKDADGDDALAYASGVHYHLETIILLLDLGAPYTRKLLIRAAEKGYLELVARGVTASNLSYADQASALVTAVFECQIEVVKFLLVAGVDVDVEAEYNSQKMTPLMAAIKGELSNTQRGIWGLNEAMVKLLLKAGASTNGLSDKRTGGFSNSTMMDRLSSILKYAKTKEVVTVSDMQQTLLHHVDPPVAITKQYIEEATGFPPKITATVLSYAYCSFWEPINQDFAKTRLAQLCDTVCQSVIDLCEDYCKQYKDDTRKEKGRIRSKTLSDALKSTENDNSTKLRLIHKQCYSWFQGNDLKEMILKKLKEVFKQRDPEKSLLVMMGCDLTKGKAEVEGQLKFIEEASKVGAVVPQSTALELCVR